MTEPLPSWAPGRTRDQLTGFLDAADAVPADRRVAVIDNDGTLWCERPNYAQLDFMIWTLRSAAAADSSLQQRPEFGALLSGDKAAIADIGLPRLAHALAELNAGIEPEAFAGLVRDFLTTHDHPTLDRPYAATVYQPMLELLDELRRREFLVFVVTGGGTEFVRSVSRELYGVTPDRVVGTLVRYDFTRRDGNPVLVRTAELDGDANEGAAKVSNIRRHLGQRPILAIGNSAGDAEMIEYATATEGPTLGVVIDHDDDEREFAYASEGVTVSSDRPFLDVAGDAGWTVVSMRNDWSTVFPS
jgi:phosphoserine phosphatase